MTIEADVWLLERKFLWGVSGTSKVLLRREGVMALEKLWFVPADIAGYAVQVVTYDSSEIWCKRSFASALSLTKELFVHMFPPTWKCLRLPCSPT